MRISRDRDSGREARKSRCSRGEHHEGVYYGHRAVLAGHWDTEEDVRTWGQ